MYKRQIPGNDDGIRSIELIVSHMADAVLAGRKNVVAKNEGADGKPAGKPKPKAAPAAAAEKAPVPAAEKAPAPAKAEEVTPPAS